LPLHSALILEQQLHGSLFAKLQENKFLPLPSQFLQLQTNHVQLQPQLQVSVRDPFLLVFLF
jgi:hypothetical protein